MTWKPRPFMRWHCSGPYGQTTPRRYGLGCGRSPSRLRCTTRRPITPARRITSSMPFDDADHAILALPVARRYADIAPAAPHALHMPSHIFLQLGMWPEAATSNEASWAASVQWVQNHHLPISERDYHSLHWWLYTVLQQGRYQQADDLLTLMRQSLAAFPDDNQRRRLYGAYTNASMAAAFVVETERWDATQNSCHPCRRQRERRQRHRAPTRIRRLQSWCRRRPCLPVG